MGCHFPLQGNLPDPEIELASLVSPALASSLPLAPPGKFLALNMHLLNISCYYQPPHQVFLPEDLLDPGIELGSPALQADALPAELPGEPSGAGLTSCYKPKELYQIFMNVIVRYWDT